MTRILFVTYSGLFGGAERVLLDCATAIDGGHALACPEGALAQAARDLGLTVYPVAERDLRLRAAAARRGRSVVELAAHARELRRLTRELEPELVMAWGTRSAIAARAGLASTHVPYAVGHHDFLPGPRIARAVRSAAAHAAVVITPSRAVADDLDPEGRLGGRLHVVAPGVAPERYADLAPVPTTPSIVVLGAIVGWKRPELAIEIAALARPRLPGLTLRIVGDPVTGDEPLVGELQALAAVSELAESVQVTGAVDDVRPELERAACLLHCAPAEPFGIVLLEALAAGRPVVAPDAGGPREIVDDGCGILYAPGSAQDGADAIVKLFSDPERVAAMGAAGRARVQAAFNVGLTRERFAHALAPALRRRPSREPAASNLTLVTVTHNSAAALSQLIASVERHLPGVELIVVDCASRDDSVAVAARRPGTRVIELGENLGFGRACNRGVAVVRTEVVALLNPDVELLDDSLVQLAEQAVAPDLQQRLLAPLVLNPDGTRQASAHPMPSSSVDLLSALIPPALLPALAPWRARAPRRVGWAVGAALVGRTETLRRLGPFDESIFMYGEDMDLGLRAAAAGIATWFWPTARVLHSGAHATAPAFGGEDFTRLARARHETVARRLGPGRARLDDRAQALTFASRAALKRFLGRSAEREARQLAAVRAVRRET